MCVILMQFSLALLKHDSLKSSGGMELKSKLPHINEKANSNFQMVRYISTMLSVSIQDVTQWFQAMERAAQFRVTH